MIINDYINEEYAKLDYCCKIDDKKNLYTCNIVKNRYIVVVYAKINDDGYIEDMKFKAMACTVVFATMNHWCRNSIGKHINELRKITNDYYIKKFELESYKEKGSIMIDECRNAIITTYMMKDEI